MKPPRAHYASIDLYVTDDGTHILEYAQWETTAAVRVHPVDKHTTANGETHIVPRGHGGPVMSLMTREDVERERIPQLLASVLGML